MDFVGIRMKYKAMLNGWNMCPLLPIQTIWAIGTIGTMLAGLDHHLRQADQNLL
jgi:hypothetical protein